MNKNPKGGSIPYREMAEIIVDSILSENFFERDMLIIKVLALIKGFKLNPSIIRGRTVDTSERFTKLHTAMQQTDLERNFWKKELEKIVGERIKEYYPIVDKLRIHHQ